MVAVSRSTSSSSSGLGVVSDARHCACHRLTWRARYPSGRPKSARPTLAGSIECSSSEGVDQLLARLPGQLRRERREPVGLVEHDPVDERHQVERGAQDLGVGAERDRPRDRDAGAAEGADHPELAAHVVRARQDVRERRTAQRPDRGAVGDPVGQVRLAARDQLARHRPGAQPGMLAVQPFRQRGKVNAREPVHEVTVQTGQSSCKAPDPGRRLSRPPSGGMPATARAVLVYRGCHVDCAARRTAGGPRPAGQRKRAS